MSPDRSYEILVVEKFPKILKKNLPTNLRKIFDRKLEYLRTNLHHPSLNTKLYNASSKILRELGVDEIYEFYINKSIRCIFYVVNDSKQIWIAYVGKHEQVKAKFA